jgi:phage terminase small subunit
MMPAEFDDEHRAFWMGTAPQMLALGRLSAHHVTAYAEYVMCVIRLKKFRQFFGSFDGGRWVYASGDMIKCHPLVAQMNDDWRKWRSLLGEFGLAPASERTMIKEFKGTHKDGWEDI